jgi:hypothetical protein
LAATLGVPVELAIRWLILMMALTCDPATIALTVAASRPKYPGTDQVRVRLQEHDVFRPAGCLECSEEIECRRSAGEPLEARNGAPDAGWGHLR